MYSVEKVIVKKDVLIIIIQSDQVSNITRLILENRLDVKEQYIFQSININKKNLIFQIKISDLNFNHFYYDFYIMLNGEKIRLKNVNKLLQGKLDFKYLSYARFQDGRVIYPYVTSKGSLSVNCRNVSDYDTKKAKIIFGLAIITSPIFFIIKKIINKKILIFFEKNLDRAEDNAFFLFRDMQTSSKYACYFISYGKEGTIKPYSFKFFLTIIVADLLVSSEGKSHISGVRMQNGLLNQLISVKPLLFLQHGVLGLKNINDVYNYRKFLSPDFFVITQPHEKDIAIYELGYPENNVVMGNMERENNIPKIDIGRYIVYMPTWRKELEELDDLEFKDSDYFLRIQEVINNLSITDLLYKQNIQIYVVMHPKLKKFQHLFPAIPELESLRVILHNADFLITDYSSVAWDFKVSNKPVLLYQVDYKAYQEKVGMYIKPSEHFSYIAHNVEDLEDIFPEFLASSETIDRTRHSNGIREFIDQGIKGKQFKTKLGNSKYLKKWIGKKL